MKNNAHL